jgi:hypothetical protein
MVPVSSRVTASDTTIVAEPEGALRFGLDVNAARYTDGVRETCNEKACPFILDACTNSANRCV